MSFMNNQGYPMASNAMTNALGMIGGSQPQVKPQTGGTMTNALAGVGSQSPFKQIVHGFAKGLAPEGYQRGVEERQQRQMGQKAAQDEQLKTTLAFGQHLRSMPQEQRVQMVAQNWDRFSQMLGANGQTFEQWLSQNPNDLTDQGLDAELMQVQAMMGQGPQKPEERKIIKAADGYNYYQDTGQRVLPDVQKDVASSLKLGEGMQVNPQTGRAEYIPGYLEAQKEKASTVGDRGSTVQSTFVANNGELVIVNRDGTLSPTGKFARNPFQITDIGGVPVAIDRQSGMAQEISSPEEVGGNAATIETVKKNEAARQAAQQELPQVIASAEQGIQNIDALLESPGFENRYGMTSLGGIAPPMPGSPGASSQAYIDQIAGQAFLQAFESLKGGGQITEIEGKQATAAITRLTNQSIPPPEARKAAEELKQILRNGIERKKAQAQASYAPQSESAGNLGYDADTQTFSAPTIGEVVDGYEYIGGDPNNPESWKQR
jgi:hypothetical protein